jgi:hypothetical protein
MLSYIIHQLIDSHISQGIVTKNLNLFFNFRLERNTVKREKATTPQGRDGSVFNKTACQVESRKSLQKTGKGMVGPLTELSTPLVA